MLLGNKILSDILSKYINQTVIQKRENKAIENKSSYKRINETGFYYFFIVFLFYLFYTFFI